VGQDHGGGGFLGVELGRREEPALYLVALVVVDPDFLWLLYCAFGEIFSVDLGESGRAGVAGVLESVDEEVTGVVPLAHDDGSAVGGYGQAG
jgi:hypothetical protein